LAAMCASMSTNDTPCLLGLSYMCVVQSASSYGITSDVYTFLIGLSAASWPLMGYDAVAHMIEETKSADTTAGKPMPYTLLTCFAIGMVYLLALTLCIQVGCFLLHCTSYCVKATVHTKPFLLEADTVAFSCKCHTDCKSSAAVLCWAAL